MRRAIVLGLLASLLSCSSVPLGFLRGNQAEPAPPPPAFPAAPGDETATADPAPPADPQEADATAAGRTKSWVSASRDISVDVAVLMEDLQGVELWVTEDRGINWRAAEMTPGCPKAISFSAPRDGWFGFQVVPVTKEGSRFHPPTVCSEPEVSVLVDTAAPIVLLTSPNGGNVFPNRGQEWVSWTARDPNLAPDGVTLEASADGGRTWSVVGHDLQNNGRAAWTLPVTSGKDYLVRVTARDLAGNAASDASDAPFTVDGFPPEGRVLGPASSSRGEVSLQYSAGDPGAAGLAKVFLWTTTDGGATWQRAAEDVDTLSPMKVVLPDGEYGLALVCVDRVGNAAEAPRPGAKPEVSLLVDSALPSVAFYDFPRAAVFPGDEDVDLAWTVSDANSRPDGVRLEISEDGGTTWQEVASGLPADKPYRWRTPSKLGRRYRLRVTAEDRIGNASRATSPEFAVDGSVPETFFQGPATSASGSVDIAYGVRNLGFAPLARVELWVMRGGDTHWERVASDDDGASPMTVQLPDGVYGVKVVCATARGIESQQAGSARGRRQAEPEAGSRPDGTLVVDSTSPQVKVTSPKAPAVYRGGETVPVAWSARDDRFGKGSVRIEWTSTGHAWKELAKGLPAEGTWRWTLPSETGDAFQVRVVAEDEAGNSSVAATERFGIDAKAPTTRVVGPTALNKASGNVARLSIEAEDAGPAGVGEVVLYRARLGQVRRWEEVRTFKTGPYQAEAGPLDDGRWGFVAVASDQKGNRGPAPDTGTVPDLEVVVDSHPPMLKLAEPKGGEVLGADAHLDVRWECEDGASVQFTVQASPDGGRTWQDLLTEAAGVRTCRWDPPARDGSWKVRVIARDEAGNESSLLCPGDVCVDAQPPQAFVAGPARSNSGSIEIEYDVQDAGTSGPGSVQLWTRGAGEADWRPGPSVDVSGGKRPPLRVVLADGAHGLFLTATDRAGNASASPSASAGPQASLVVDSQAPTVALLSPEPGAAFGAGAVAAVRWQANDRALEGACISIEVSTDRGRAWTTIAAAEANDGAFDWTVPSSDGDGYLVRVRATDAFGNRGEATIAGPFVIDSRPPTVSIDGPVSWRTPEGDLFLRGRDEGLSGIDHVEFWTTTNGGATWAGPLAAPWGGGKVHCTLPEGKRGLFARAVDRAGNAGAAPKPGTPPQALIDVDAGAPGLSVSGIAEGDLFRAGQPVAIAWEAVDDGLAEGPVRIEVRREPSPPVVIEAAGPAKGQVSWTPSEDGTYTIAVIARDSVGNEARFEAHAEVDGAAPEMHWVQAPEGGTLAGGVEVDLAWTLDDAHAESDAVVLSFSPDRGATWQSVRADLAACGRTVWRVPEVDCLDCCLLRLSAKDRLGNAAEVVTAKPFGIVTNSPPVRIDLPAARREGAFQAPLRWLFGRETIACVKVWHTTDGGRRWSLMHTLDAATTDQVPLDLLEGMHGFLLACDRTDGTSGEDPRTGTPPQHVVSIDGTAPVVTLFGAHDGDVVRGGGEIDVAWEARDEHLGPAAVTVKVREDGREWREFPAQADRGAIPVPVGADAREVEIRVIARDVAGNEAAASVTLAVDGDEPEATVASTVGKCVRARERVTVTWTAKDSHLGERPAELRWSANGGRTWQTIARGLPGSGQAVWTAPATTSRDVRIAVLVTDRAGRWVNAELPARFLVDAEPPTPRTAPVGIVSAPNVQVECAAEDDATGVQSIELWVRAAGASTWERAGQAAVAQAQFPLARPDGAYELLVVATDGAGNRSAVPDDSTAPTADCVFDREGPLVDVGGLEQGLRARAGGMLDLEWSARDANGVQNVWVECAERAGGPRRALRSALPAAGAMTIDLPLREGEMTLWVRAQDVAGHVTSREVPVTLHPDGPIVRITGGLEGGSIWRSGETVHIGWKVDGATEASIEQGGPGAEWQAVRTGLPAEGTIDLALPTETRDVLRFRVVASDASGARGEAQVSISVDGDAPRCTLSAPAVSRDRHVRIRVRAEDVGRAGVAGLVVHGRSRGQKGWRILQELPGDVREAALALDEGTTELCVVAVDRAGNASPAPDAGTQPAWAVVVDSQAPRVALPSLPTFLQVAPGSRVPVEWVVDDSHVAEGAVRLVLTTPGGESRVVGDGLPAKWNAQVDMPTDLGEVLLSIEARDAAGNVGTAVVTFQVTDRPVPLSVSTPLARGGSVRGGTSVPLSWKLGPSADPATVSVMASEGTAGPWFPVARDLGASGEVTIAIPPRDLEDFLVQVEARQGDRVSVLATYRVSVDVHPPTVDVTTPNPSSDRHVRVPFEARDEGTAGIARVLLLARPIGGGSWREVGRAEGVDRGAVEAELEEGAWEICAVAEDAAGNRSGERAAESPVVVDTRGPAILLADGGDVIPVTPGAPIGLSWEAQDDHPADRAVTIEWGPEGQPLTEAAAGLPSKGTWEATAPQQTGTWRVRIAARDALGNLSAVERTVRVEPRPAGPSARISVKEGETLDPGARVEFSWDAGMPDLQEKGVALLLSSDGGRVYRPIAEGLDRIGSYAWTPAEDLPDAMVKVVARQRDGRLREILPPRTFSVMADRPRVALTAKALPDAGAAVIGIGVKTAGKGIASIRVWMTQDGGQTWTESGEHEGCPEEVAVDVPSEGRYGFFVSPRDSEGIAWDAVPRPGTAPQASVVVDGSAPRVALKNFLGGEAYAGGATLLVWWEAEDALLAADGVDLFLSQDGGTTWEPIAKGLRASGRFPWSLPQASGSTFRLKVVARDEAGHVAEAVSERDFVIDSTTPQVDVSIPDTIGGKSAELPWSPAGAELSAIARVTAWLTPDGGATWTHVATAVATKPVKFDFPASGTFGLCFVAENEVGNAGAPPGPGTPPSHVVTVDLEAPAVRMLAPAAGEMVRPGEFDVRWEALDDRLTDAPVTILTSTDGGETWSRATSEPIGNFGRARVRAPQGASELRVKIVVRDAAGHEGAAEGGPYPVGTGVLAGRITGVTTEGEVLYEADGAGRPMAALEVWTSRDDGRTWERSTRAEGADARPRVTLPDSGLLALWLVVEDEAGERSDPPVQGSVPMWVTVIDRSAPEVALLSPCGGEIVAGGKPMEVRWEAKDEALGDRPVRIFLSEDDGATWVEAGDPSGLPNAGSAQVPVPARSGAAWRVRVTVADATGNAASADSPRAFVVDADPPACRLLGPAVAARSEVDLQADVRDVGPAGVATVDLYEWTGGKWVLVASAPAGTVVRFRGVDGSHPLAIVATDKVGNAQTPPSAESDAQCVLVMRTDGPSVAIAPMGERVRGGTEVHVGWVSHVEAPRADAVTVEWSKDGGATWEVLGKGLSDTGTFAWKAPKEDLPRCILRVTIVDAHGRVGSSETTSEFQVRSKGPQIERPRFVQPKKPQEAPTQQAAPKRPDPPKEQASPKPEEPRDPRPSAPAADIARVRELWARGDYKDAAEACTSVIAANPMCAEAHYRLALCLAMTRRPEEASDEFKKAVDIEPTNAELKNAFGVMLLMREDLDGAERQFRAALDLGDDPMSRHNLGIVLYQKKDFDAARGEFERALALNPKGQDSIFYIAYLDIAAADWAKARARLEECIGVDPTSQTASQARAAIETLPR